MDRFRCHAMMAILLLSVLSIAPLNADEQPEPPWMSPYSGEASTGESVIGLWQFNPGAEVQDSSGKGHHLKLRGESRFVPQGRFGSCLESFPSGQENDHAQGALATNHPDLSPQGAFTIEMWFKAKPEFEDARTVFLLDKKYYHYAKDLPRANRDYCLYLRSNRGQRQFVAYLGYGNDSAEYSSRAVDMVPKQWYHVAFTYDGAGRGRFYLNGQSIGRTYHEDRGPIAAGNYHLVLGDRYGSIYNGFPGFIDEVRLSKGIVPTFAGSLEVDLAGSRTAFRRGEQNCHLAIGVINDTGEKVSQGTATVTLGERQTEISLPQLAPTERHVVNLAVDARLRPGEYPVQVVVTGIAGGKLRKSEKAFPLTLVPRQLPHQMPVVLWGSGDMETLKEIGFTHQLAHTVDYAKVWAAGRPTSAMSTGDAARVSESLDRYLAEGMGAVANLSPGRWITRNEELKKEYQRVNRDGQPTGRENVCAQFPKVQSFAYNVGASVAQTFGEFPAWQSALIHTEIRDSTDLCFHGPDREAYRTFAGTAIPAQAVSKAGVAYSTIDGFPANRVVPDDDPILAFYRWFWKQGDGWNTLHSQVHRGLKSTGRQDLWTFFDPAVRVPTVWGSGGEVDVVSQWTYSYPDPIKIGQATDELFAMADGKAGQRVMKMTQIIWYRSQTAPGVSPAPPHPAAWEDSLPDARFITIAPDHLREAFWSKIARPIQGIMYHGWGSLVGATHGSYQFTHPQTREVLAELVREVVTPLGPTLLQVPDRPSDVGLLESFAAQVFARRGTLGWSRGWVADTHLVLQWAQLQPRILFDETVLRDGLNDLRVLVLPHGEVLTEEVVQIIQEFQQRGGILVADEHLVPALTPDIQIATFSRTGHADRDKTALQERAAALRRQLDGLYPRYADSSQADVIVRCRRYREADYVFLVNDHRTFGDYVGHHGKVMERGLAQSAEITIARKTGHVYDLVNHRQIAATKDALGIRFSVNLQPGDGRVLWVSDQELSKLRITSPQKAERGRGCTLRVTALDPSAQPLRAVVPLRVEILDPQGREAEFSGYYGAQDGQLVIHCELAPNDLAGQWTIRATELATGKISQLEMTVE